MHTRVGTNIGLCCKKPCVVLVSRVYPDELALLRIARWRMLPLRVEVSGADRRL